jgi:hypothetical protein
MYESMNGTGMSRLPKVQAPAPASPVTNALGRTVGTAVVQAVAVVVVARIVDALLESYMNRRRAQQQPQPGARHHEHAHA